MPMSFLDQLESYCTEEKPVSFGEFVKSPEYCNYPDLYDWWLHKIDTFGGDCTELILDGSIGSGKSTVAAYYFAYRVYLLFFGSTPQSKLRVPDNTDVYGLYFSINLKTAEKSGFSLLYSIFKDCKWFQTHAPIDTKLRSSIEFVDRKFHINFASNFAHQLSLNVCFFILDEANFRSGVGSGTAEEYSEVTELYGQLLDRTMSRFARPDGSSDTLAILVSSASYQSSFSEKRKEAIKNCKTSHAITGVKYEITPERYSSVKFKVFIGAGTSEPCIIESDEQYKRVMENANLLGTGQEEEFIRMVPENLRSQFEYNIVRALQNHCGIPTTMSSGFMPNMNILFNSYVDDIPMVFQNNELEASTEDTTELIQYVLPDAFEFPERPHSLYLDLSLQHDTGVLCCYRYDGTRDGLNYHTRVFSLQIIPPKFPYQTSIRKVKQLVLDLATTINVVAFASDQFQSDQLRQEIQEELGLENIRISLDSTDAPHMHWIRALVEGRIRQTEDHKLQQECMENIHDWSKHKVIKPKGGSDDVLQANIGAFWISDTFGVNGVGLEGLSIGGSGRYNLVGGQSISNILKKLGYK